MKLVMTIRRNTLRDCALRMLVIGLIGTLGACAGTTASSRTDKGDEMVAKLRVGMDRKEVLAAIGPPELVAVRGQEKTSIGYEYQTDRYPYDILSRVPLDAPYWVYPYWASSNNKQFLHLYFDAGEKQLLGWTKQFSQYARRKFRSERLTGRLEVSSPPYRGMSRAEVYAMIGAPQEKLQLPPRSREIYEDHYWSQDPHLTLVKEIEKYQYEYKSGQTRTVYLGYYRGADELRFFGFNHAWEEAERYLAEQAAKQKK